MKKTLFFFLFFIMTTSIFSQNLGDKIYKEVIIDDEIVNRWVQYTLLEEYDTEGRLIHSINNYKAENFFDYDSKGNLIHTYDNRAFEGWYEYDKNGNKIHFIDTGGQEDFYEYNSKGNLIHYKSNSFLVGEEWLTYDNNNNVIYYKTGYGIEGWNEYDSSGNLVYFHDSNGNEIINKYNSSGQIIYHMEKDINATYISIKEELSEYNLSGLITYYKKKSSYPDDDKYYITEQWTEYNSNKQVKYFKELYTHYDGHSSTQEHFYEYNINGKTVVCIYSDDTESISKYDNRDNQIYYKNFKSGYEEWNEYDSHNNLVSNRVKIPTTNDEPYYDYYSTLKDTWYEYEYYSDGTIKTKKTFTAL